ncbi:MAG: hypothetical protein JXR30_03630 [Alphaproteobacteria bacterium]|nr:hypothetical protein [Alphaproteobacteria bacterium]
MKRIFLSFCFLSFSVHAIDFSKYDFPLFDFSTSVPLAPNPIRYDVITTSSGESELKEVLETTSVETPKEEEVKDALLAKEYVTFPPRQKILSSQSKKLIENIVVKMKKYPESKVYITLFFYQGTGFETSESKRLALKRSLELKKEFQKHQIRTAQIFLQIKETIGIQTSHTAQISLKSF